MAGDNNNDDDGYPDRRQDDTNNIRPPEPSPYSFNGKVVMGIGLIVIASAISTLLAMSVSKSPQAHLTVGSSTLVPLSVKSAAAQSQSEHIDKKFLLIQRDFGWNGTTGGPTITVNKGDVVQIAVINAGHMDHNFGIALISNQSLALMEKTDNMTLPQRMDYIPYNVMADMPCPGCQEVFKEGHIDEFMNPDTMTVTTFKANQAGHFMYYCQVRGHIWLGMKGDFVVTENAPTTSNESPGNQHPNTSPRQIGPSATESPSVVTGEKK
jgi:FtsP/CotA-like multicopper oxidase with cupredoxin domain